MRIYKYLYTKMYDDLKDADMLVEYAEKMKEDGDAELTKYFGELVLARLKSFKDAHTLFQQRATKEGHTFGKNKDLIESYLWEKQHKQLQDWYHKIEECVKKI